MVVTNLNFLSSVIPFKANSILIIDAYAKLILPFSCESLEMVRRWYAGIFDLTCLVDQVQFIQDSLLNRSNFFFDSSSSQIFLVSLSLKLWSIVTIFATALLLRSIISYNKYNYFFCGIWDLSS